jgi:hypothetical protein
MRRGYAAPVAKSTPFDNATNGFTATETQAAIEEAKATATGLPRLAITLTANGTATDLAWITYSEVLANPRILLPIKTRLKEFTWNNSNTSVRALNFLFYKNGQAGGNLVYTYTPPAGDRTAGYGYFIFPSNLDWNAGDSLYVQVDYTAAGTSLSDLAAVCWISQIL